MATFSTSRTHRGNKSSTAVRRRDRSDYGASTCYVLFIRHKKNYVSARAASHILHCACGACIDLASIPVALQLRTKTMSLVLDNGAYSLKVGLALDQEPRVIPNCITR